MFQTQGQSQTDGADGLLSHGSLVSQSAGTVPAVADHIVGLGPRRGGETVAGNEGLRVCRFMSSTVFAAT